MLHQTRSTRFGKQSISCLQVTGSCLLKIKIKSKATSIFIKTWSLEGLPTKAKEDPSPHEMRLSPVGHQPSISWSQGNLLLLLFLLLLLLLLFIFFSLLSRPFNAFLIYFTFTLTFLKIFLVMLHQTRSARFGKQPTSYLQVTASCLLKIKIKS